MSLLLLFGGSAAPLDDALIVEDAGEILDEVLKGSLHLSLNTLDFVLVDPDYIPEPLATVELDMFGEVYWTGAVTSVSEVDAVEVGQHTYVTVACTNSEVASVGPAPFGVSDDPDDVTTFGYKSIQVDRTRVDGDTELTVKVTCLEPGLAPGMTVALTSANHAFSAEEFTITNLRLSWLMPDRPVFDLELGDPIATLSAFVEDQAAAGVEAVFPIDGTKMMANAIEAPHIAANAVIASKIAAGAVETAALAADAIIANVVNAGGTVVIDSSGITITDDQGQVLLTGSGFGASWRRFIQSGAYNSDFASEPPTPASELDTATNPLPGWETYTKVSGTAISAMSVADGSVPSGRSIEFTVIAGAASDQTAIEQLIPVVGGLGQSYRYTGVLTLRCTATPLPAGLSARVTVQYIQSDGTTPTGSESGFTAPTPASNAVGRLTVTLPNVPTDAAYVRIRLAVRRTGANGLTGTIRLCEFTLSGNPPQHVFADQTDPDTYPTNGKIVMSTGRLELSGGDGAEIRVENGDASSERIVLVAPGGIVTTDPLDIGADLTLDDATGTITQYGNNAPTAYTPTVTNAVGAKTATGWYWRIGKMIFFNAYIVFGANQTGAGTIAISAPTSIARTARQSVSGVSEGNGVAGHIVAVALTSGSGADFDRIRSSTGTNIIGTDCDNAGTIVISGWYREA